MRWVHRITVSAFAKPEENVEGIREAVIALVPFDLNRARVVLGTENAQGFDERIIKIFSVSLTREAQTNDFLDFLLNKFSDEQKRLLISQAESRLDANLDFFIRIDKDHWVNEREFWLTDSGSCFHIKLAVAAYPKKRDAALLLIRKLFSQKSI
ncbi:MAG TPA: RNA-binding domain-containing protein [Candidatus Nanoarchaeia archaeon]|nr:RNA-binding domain-containing protein [Candidatus Nanoarchaeia archaeon]